MKKTLWKLGFASSLFAAACAGVDSGVKHSLLANGDRPSASAVEDDDENAGDDQDIALGDLPQAVKNAALAAVPGLVLTRAEKETENGRELYSVEGTANGKSYCVEVATDGTLIGVENDDDDDDADDDDDDDDDADDEDQDDA